MGRDEDKLIRQLSLLSFLLSRRRPVTAREVQESVEGYAEMSDETFTRRFHADRADLAKIGIEVHAAGGGDAPDGGETQLYYPKGWQHSNTDTFAVATLGDAEGFSWPLSRGAPA